ncbi:FAD-dependent oxidoreductase [Nocardia sp. NPDC003482]
MTEVLIIGGGISGLAASLVLARQGATVDLVERQPRVAALGSGITLIGPALRALAELGVLNECLARGYGSTEFRVRAPDGSPIADSPLPVCGPGLPGLLGMTRPDLHRILLDHAVAAGADIRTGLSPFAIADRPDRAVVRFDDGTEREYDLVVAADGLRSTVRGSIFGELTPTFRNQVCVRAVLPRLDDIDQEVQYHGVPQRHVGFTPTGLDSMYLYCCAPVGDTTRPAPEELPSLLRALLADFGGTVARARELITDPAQVHYAPLETIVAPAPWFSGRTVLIGDAAHATTPQLAAGAAMCLEDGLALGAELAAAPTIPDALQAFSKRRFDRCRYVVETSVRLAAWQILPHTPDDEQRRLTGEAFEILAGPY